MNGATTNTTNIYISTGKQISTFCVYFMYHPERKEGYIGITSHHPRERFLTGHVEEAFCRPKNDKKYHYKKSQWLRKIFMEEGTLNSIKHKQMTESIYTLEEAGKLEVEFIKAAIKKGYKLMNTTSGGDFCHNVGKKMVKI